MSKTNKCIAPIELMQPSTSCSRATVGISIPESLVVATLFAITLISATGFGIVPLKADACDELDALRNEAKSRLGIVDSVSAGSRAKPIVELGQKLFWDTRLSANGKVACASCHGVESWGADAEQFSLDAKGKRTKRNSQTVFNATLQPGLRWTADRKSAAHQAEKSLTGSMGFAQADEVVPLLKKYGYEASFQSAFPDQEISLNPANYAKAIEAYEMTLTTPASFDRFLEEEKQAISDEARKGLRIFLDVGCADCHSGKLLGGEKIEKFGVHRDFWLETKSEKHDEGLFESTQKDEDRFHFRVSMLRNIEKTGPYFHDGSVADLSHAVQVMAKLQLDIELEQDQIDAVVAFLKTLTGEIPSNYTESHH